MSDTPNIPKALRASLLNILGPEGLLDAQEDLRCYSFDLFARGLPDLVALPADTQQTARVIALANEYDIAVTPRGAASSLTGGPVPVAGGIALATTRMNAILEVSPADRLARVQAGVVTDDLKRAAHAKGLLYAPDPTSAAYCTIGGNIATNAGGAAGVKYGVTRDSLMGITVVLPSGEILQTGGRCHKSVTGYDFTHFLCGSEGQLGVITEATVKLQPLPEAVRTVLGYFPDLEATAHGVAKAVGAGLPLSTLEIMDSGFLSTVQQVYGVEVPEGVGAALLAEVDGPSESVDRYAESVHTLFTESGAIKTRLARGEDERQLLWKARKGGTAALVRSAKFMVTLDYAVPLATMAKAITAVQSLAEELDIHTVIIGHAGDGNLHPMCIFDPDSPDELARFQELEHRSCQTMLELGGTLSGEHGIGLEKAPLMADELGQTAMDLSQRVKKAFDPKMILNPGKGEWAKKK